MSNLQEVCTEVVLLAETDIICSDVKHYSLKVHNAFIQVSWYSFFLFVFFDTTVIEKSLMVFLIL